MALGTEVGDAYISVHANTSPYRTEVQGLRKFTDKEMGKVNDALELEGAETGTSRVRDMKHALAETSSEGKRMKSQSSEWISPKLNKRAKVADKRLLDLQNSLSKLSNNDMQDADILGEFEDQTRRAVKGVTDLNEEMDKASRTARNKYTKNMRRADHQTLSLGDRTKDLRTSLSELRKGFKEVGDEKGIETVDRRMRKLEETTREQKHSLVGLKKGTDEYNDVMTKTSRSIGAQETNMKKLDRTLQDSRVEHGKLQAVKQKQLEVTKEVNRAHGEALKINNKLNESIKKTTKSTDKGSDSFRRMRQQMKRTSKKNESFSKSTGNMSNKVRGAFRRMDRTVKLVLVSIVAAGPQLAAGLSGVGAAAVSLIAVVGGAIAALAPLAGVIAPAGYGLILAVAGLKDLEKYSPGAAGALDDLKSAFKDVALSDFMEEWSGSLEGFFDTLATSLRESEVAKKIGEAFAGITDAFTDVLKGRGWEAFMTAIEGPLSRALEDVGEAFSFIMEGAFNFMAATAPLAEGIAGAFRDWAKSWADMQEKMRGSGETLETFTRLKDALKAVVDLIGSVASTMSTVLGAALPFGISMVETLTQMIDDFDAFLAKPEGKTALDDWLRNGTAMMGALGGLIADLGTTLGSLVTEETSASFALLAENLGEIVKWLGALILAAAESGLLDSVGTALVGILEALEPLIKPFGDLLELLGDVFDVAFEYLNPILEDLAELLGGVVSDTVAALSPLVDELAAALDPLEPIVAGIIESFKDFWEQNKEKILTGLTTLFEMILEDVVPAFIGMWEAIGPLIESLLDLAEELLNDEETMNSLKAAFKLLIGVIKVAFWVVETLIGWITSLVDVLDGPLKLAINTSPILTLVKWFDKVSTSIQIAKDKLASLITKLKRGIPLPDFSGGISLNNILSGFGLASGALLNGPTLNVAGEDGAEAVVPLDRALSRVAPEVRTLSAIAQGKEVPGDTNSRSITIEAGAIVVSAPESDVALVAESVLDRIVAYAT